MDEEKQPDYLPQPKMDEEVKKQKPKGKKKGGMNMAEKKSHSKKFLNLDQSVVLFPQDTIEDTYFQFKSLGVDPNNTFKPCSCMGKH